MKFTASAVALVALATNVNSFAPAGKAASKSMELNMLSHYSYDKPPHHPDYSTNMNNFVLDEYSGLSYEEAETFEEHQMVRNELLAEELRQEETAIAVQEAQAEEDAFLQAAAERQAIREADEAREKAAEEVREEARKAAAEQLAAMKAEQEKYYAMEAAEEEKALAEQPALTPEEEASYELKSGLSSEDVSKMVGLRGWRRMQFMDNTLDGTIIKRFPNKGPNHPDSRTNNKHFDMNEYYDMSYEDYQAYREEARLEARRIMGRGKDSQMALQAAKADARMAAEQRGKIARETMWKLSNEEANNRIMMKRW